MSRWLPLLLGVALAPVRASAEIGLPLEYAIDPFEAGVDTTAPEPLRDVEVEVYRGQWRGTCSQGSHDDLGQVVFRFATPVDDRSPADRMGVRARLVEGALPSESHATFFENPVAIELRTDALGGTRGTTSFYWMDGREDTQEPVHFALELIPLDLAGNEGAPTVVTVADPQHVGGCSAAATHRWDGLDLLGLVGLFVLVRPRRPLAA